MRNCTAAFLIALAACRTAPPSPAPLDAPGVTVGDSAAFGARVERVDIGQARATYHLDSAAHVVMLVVTPDRSIEPIVPDATVTRLEKQRAGSHVVSLRRLVPGTRGVAARGILPDDLPAQARMEYERCVDAAVRARTPPPPPPPPTKRDSAGRPIGDPPVRPPPRDPDPKVQRNAEAACAAEAMRRNPPKPEPPPAPPPERYVVVFASDYAVSARQLAELSIAEGDIASIVQMIARKLYAPRGVVWSAHYLRW